MKPCRRQFLQYAGAGVAAMAMAGLPGKIMALTRQELEEDTAARKDIRGLDSVEEEILYLASLAPSGHNAQPWKVQVAGRGHFIVGITPDRYLPAVDPANRETMLSMGAFIENLVQAAGSRGYSASVQVVARNLTDTRVAEVKLVKASTTRDSIDAIRKRRTVRSDMKSGIIRDNDISDIADHLGKDLVYYPRGSEKSEFIRKATIEANRVQAYRDPAQKELSEFIQWSDGNAEKYRYGLTPESMGITGIAGWFVKHFFNREKVMEKGFRETSVKKATEQANQGAGWIVIRNNGNAVAQLIQTGRLYERMCLETREKNIAIHPMSQALEEKPFMDQVQEKLGNGKTVQFLLRVGYVDNYPKPVSIRRPVSWFVEQPFTS